MKVVSLPYQSYMGVGDGFTNQDQPGGRNKENRKEKRRTEKLLRY
jgi:hypothetical protein